MSNQNPSGRLHDDPAPSALAAPIAHQIDVSGPYSRNWPEFNPPERSAVILNPAAQPGDMLAWCWGEIASLRIVADHTSETLNEDEFADVMSIFLNKLGSIEQLMARAIDALAAAERKKSVPG